MRRRLLTTILSITAASILLFAIPLGFVVARLIDQRTALTLERQAILAARNIPADFATGHDPTELPTDTGTSYSLYGADGRLITGAGPVTADALTRQALTNRVVDGEVDESLLVVIPIVTDETVTGALRVEQSTSVIDARRTRAISLIVGLGAGIVAIATGVGWLFASRLVRPIKQIRDATVRLGTGDFAIETPTSRVPELAETSAALAATAHRLDALITRERAFSADASHQLRTPLTAMRTTLEAELAYPRPNPTTAINEALGDIERLEITIAELLDLARTNDRPEPIELEPVLASLGTAWAPRIAKTGRGFRVESTRYAPAVIGHATMLRHALDVLVDNALTHGKGDITIHVAAENRSVNITVNDQGTGFPPSTLNHSDNTGGSHTGEGRGLPLARRLVAAQHARLTIAPPPGGHVTIQLRRAQGSAGAERPATFGPEAQKRADHDSGDQTTAPPLPRPSHSGWDHLAGDGLTKTVD